jgi:O-acetyl-ADP-ribose deacetylase (regulator of RNase III)
MFYTEYNGVLLLVTTGDLTKIKTDAIVNPANSFGFMGGGVALAIKRAGGEDIEKEAVSKAPVQIGSAVATTAGRLKAKFVIHAPTMAEPAGDTNEGNVRVATLAALECAVKEGVKSIAFPGMGTGVGGLAYETAAEAMIEAIKEFASKSRALKEIILVAYGEELANCFVNALKK